MWPSRLGRSLNLLFGGVHTSYAIRIVSAGLLVTLLRPTLAKGQQVSPAFSSIDFPGATSTAALGINNAGQIVGWYTVGSGLLQGFSLSGGKFSALHSHSGSIAEAYGINNLGEISGTYTGSDGRDHGFLLRNGRFSTIDDPLGNCQGPVGPCAGTTALGINDRSQIVGFYSGLCPDGGVSQLGTGDARNIRITQLGLRTLAGTGTVTFLGLLPLPVGGLPTGKSVTLSLGFGIPSTVTKFSISENGTLQNTIGGTYSYSMAQVVYQSQ